MSSIHILYNHTPAAPLRPHPELCCGFDIFNCPEVVYHGTECRTGGVLARRQRSFAHTVRLSFAHSTFYSSSPREFSLRPTIVARVLLLHTGSVRRTGKFMRVPDFFYYLPPKAGFNNWRGPSVGHSVRRRRRLVIYHPHAIVPLTGKQRVV